MWHSECLEIFQCLLEEGKAASTLKVFVAAISAYHVPVEGSSLGSHNIVYSFLKGARHLKPAWNPCKEMPSNGKTAFLLAVASVKRVGELHALSVSELCLRWLPDNSGVVLWPNPSFLPNVLLPQFINQYIELASFQTSSGSDSSNHLLCPVCALKCYVGTTAQFRRSDQLFVYYGGVKKCAPMSKHRLSNWIVETIILAYKAAGRPLPSSLTYHFTRASHRASLHRICTVRHVRIA